MLISSGLRYSITREDLACEPAEGFLPVLLLDAPPFPERPGSVLPEEFLPEDLPEAFPDLFEALFLSPVLPLRCCVNEIHPLSGTIRSAPAPQKIPAGDEISNEKALETVIQGFGSIAISTGLPACSCNLAGCSGLLRAKTIPMTQNPLNLERDSNQRFERFRKLRFIQ